ncbi:MULTISPECIES: UTRA domain-containing protein [unclassified Nocardioides]|uniref:GntR family transcriptional regulator n=1 Tax=unclassified Nocardioides TaxID=2615069 RepID=UPI001EE457DC|nr:MULTISPECIES: UTRA domain-containing protein [unclassified Nocardioides]
MSRLTSYTEEMARRGLLAESQTLLARREQAGPGVARALNVTEGDAVIHWRRLRRADSAPMCVEDAYLNEVLLPGFLQSGMPTSLYDALDSRALRPNWAEDSINADVASEEEAGLLDITAGTPVLRHSRRALCGEKVVEVSRTVYRADRFTMWIQVGSES